MGMKMKLKIQKILTFALLGVTLAFTSQSFADDAANAAVKQRQMLMENIKNTVGALSAAVKGGASQEDTLKAADAFLAAANSKTTIAAFQTNTHGKSTVKTTATETVWTDWVRFEQALTDLESGAKEIQMAAAGGTLSSADQLGVALKECGFCHRQAGYRSR